MSLRTLGLGLAIAVSGCAAVPRGHAQKVLPLRRLELYEIGVGYFERSGWLPAEGTTLPVPLSHLDDALKTLVVLGPTTVQSVGFASGFSQQVARALAGAPAGSDQTFEFAALVRNLKGRRVALRADNLTASGRLVDVTSSGSEDSDGGAASHEVLLLTDDAELVHLPLASIRSVRPLDVGDAERLDSAFEALGPHVAREQRLLSLLGSAAEVSLGYVSEAPVYRVSYRLVLGAEGQPAQLQAWALIHNDTDEDWTQVAVELLNGEPDSFLYPLTAPRYKERPLRTPGVKLETVSQLLTSTPDDLWDSNGEGDEAFGIGGIGTTGFGGMGGASSSTVVEQTGSSSLLKVGDLAAVAQAASAELGALFRYRLATPVDVPARHSALLPFLSLPLRVEPLTIFTADAVFDPPPPRSGIRVVNETGQTLPAGTVALFDRGTFAGEAELTRLKPGQDLVVDYGNDLDAMAEGKINRRTEVVKRLTFSAGQLWEHFLRSSEVTVKLENRSAQPKTLALRLSIDRNGQVKGADGVYFDRTANQPLAILKLGPATKVSREIATEEGLGRSHPLQGLKTETLEKLAAAPDLSERERVIARDATARQAEVDGTDKALAEVDDASKETEAELGRLREDLKSIGEGASASGSALIPRVVASEDALNQLHQKAQSLKVVRARQAKAVETALAKLDAQ